MPQQQRAGQEGSGCQISQVTVEIKITQTVLLLQKLWLEVKIPKTEDKETRDLRLSFGAADPRR